MVDIDRLMKQAERLREDISRQLDELEVEGSAGGGAVKVRMNGRKEVLGVEISPEAVDPGDLTVLEDLVQAAANDAVKAVEARLAGTLGGSMPPGMPLG